jgi:hypothetical protein
LDNSNYDNFHNGGDFSHGYVIMHKYFGKKPKMQKISTYIFVYNLTCCMHENFLHMLLTFGATNCKQVNEYIKNQPNAKKMNHSPYYPFKINPIVFKILMSYII